MLVVGDRVRQPSPAPRGLHPPKPGPARGSAALRGTVTAPWDAERREQQTHTPERLWIQEPQATSMFRLLWVGRGRKAAGNGEADLDVCGRV